MKKGLKLPCLRFYVLILNLTSIFLFSSYHDSKVNEMTLTLDFYTSYNQFYITSDGGAGLTFDPTNWTDSAYRDRLFLLKNMLVVRTESYGHVQGQMHILDKPNEKANYNMYDHVVEGGIDVKSGVLQILDCPNSSVEVEVKIKPGIYRARVYTANMAGFDSDEEESKDRYTLEIWPDIHMERKVIKRYTSL